MMTERSTLVADDDGLEAHLASEANPFLDGSRPEANLSGAVDKHLDGAGYGGFFAGGQVFAQSPAHRVGAVGHVPAPSPPPEAGPLEVEGDPVLTHEAVVV